MIIVYAIFAYICISVASMILFVITGDEANGNVVLGGLLWPISLPLFILCQLYDLCIKMLKIIENEVRNKNKKSGEQLIADEATLKKDKLLFKIKIRDLDDLPKALYGVYPVISYDRSKKKYIIETSFYENKAFKDFGFNKEVCKWLDVEIIEE